MMKLLTVHVTNGHLEKCPDEPEPGQRTSPGLGILAFGRS